MPHQPQEFTPREAAPDGPLPIPHAPPFRLIDRVVRVELDRGRLVAERRLTVGDALWPAEAGALLAVSAAASPAAATLARWPSVLVIEALCQAAACLNGLELAAGRSPLGASPSAGAPGAHLGYLVAISDFRFHDFFKSEPDAPQSGPPLDAGPGDTLLLHVERQGGLGALVAFAARAEVLYPGGPARPLASGRLLFAVNPK